MVREDRLLQKRSKVDILRGAHLHSYSDGEACERKARSRSCVQSRVSLPPLSFCATCARSSAALRIISPPGKEHAGEERDGGDGAGDGRESAAGAVDVGSDVVRQAGGRGGCGSDLASMGCERKVRCWEEETRGGGETNGKA